MIIETKTTALTGIVIASIVGIALWLALFAFIGWWFNWTAMTVWFLSLGSIVFGVFGYAMILSALHNNDDDDNDDEHQDNFIG